MDLHQYNRIRPYIVSSEHRCAKLFLKRPVVVANLSASAFVLWARGCANCVCAYVHLACVRASRGPAATIEC